MLVLLLLLFTAGLSATVTVDQDSFCSTLLINSTDPGLRISREFNHLDFAYRHEYKELHCCFANYDTIEWYKNGTRLLEGKTNITTFNTAKDRNQSLFTTRLHDRDSGTYTCVARRGSKVIRNNINLTVIVHDVYEGPPVLTTQLEDLYAWEGESRRFCCEAFVGFGDQNFMKSEVLWLPANLDEFVSSDVANTTYYNRNNGEILGALLTFEPVTKKAFGSYTCKIMNGNTDPVLINVTLHEGDDPNVRVRTTYKATLIILAVFTTLSAVIIMAVVRYHLELQLLWKDRMGKLEEDDDRVFDVFVCYDSDDAQFVLGTLVPVLEQHCQYRCFAWERDSLAGEWLPEIYTQRVRESRRFLMVLSPSLANNSWCIYALYVAIDHMLSRRGRIICVLLQEIDWDAVRLEEGPDGGCTLRQVTRVVRLVKWDPRPAYCRKFWYRLRLNLPSRRRAALRLAVPSDQKHVSSSQEALVDMAN